MNIQWPRIPGTLSLPVALQERIKEGWKLFELIPMNQLCHCPWGVA